MRKSNRIWKRLFIVAAATSIGVLHAATNDPASLLQQGLFEEEANRNYGAAAQAYQAVVSQFDSNRVLAATAVFRLGEIYRREGKTNEAAAQYRRIVQEFSDQEELVKLSQGNLPGNFALPEAEDAVRGRLEARRALEALQNLSPAERVLLIQQQYPNEVLTKLVQEQQDTEQKLAERSKEVGPQHPDIVALQTRLKEINRQIDGQVNTTVARLKLEAQRNGPSSPTQASSPELDRIRELIRNSPDLINAPQANGETLLEAAAGKGSLEVVKLLLENGAVVNGIRLGSFTPLHFAAANGHKAVLDYLLAHGANPAAATSEGLTPLHLAAWKGYVAVATALLDKGAPINVASGIISGAGFEDLNVPSAGPGTTPLRLALKGRYRPMVQLLISKGADVNMEDGDHRTALHFATIEEEADMVKDLLKAGANPNASDKPVLLLACAHGRTNIARLLLESGADPNANGLMDSAQPANKHSPLGTAIGARSLGLVELLLNFKADPNALSGDTPPVILAAEQPQILPLLLEGGAKPDQRKQGDCRTALQIAAEQNVLKSVRLLLSHGADVNGAVPPCWPLVIYGVDHCTPEVYAAILDAHPDLKVTLNHGETAVHRAVFLQRPEHLKLLLEHGADPNVRSNSGQTPLAAAKQMELSSGQGQKQAAASMVALLREHGALENLPEPDRILVQRASSNYSRTAFQADTNGWNDFTLLEVLGRAYGLLSDARSGVWRVSEYQEPDQVFGGGPNFPDFANLVLRQITADGRGWSNRTINATELINSGVCSADTYLQMGDVLEMPEADHSLAEAWSGLNDAQRQAFVKCLSRTVMIQQRGTNASMTLKPICEVMGSTAKNGRTVLLLRWAPTSFMLRSVLDQMKLIRFSSDLSRIKVTRPNDRSGKKREWILDCTDPETAPPLWLREGDIVEIPDKE